MNKITKVEITWSENGLYQRLYNGLEPSNPPSFGTLEKANSLLRRMSYEASDLGYDKTGFRITWEDGHTYEGRYDLHRYDQKQENPNGFCDLADHVRAFVKFHTGDHCPHWMTQEKYEQVLKFYKHSDEFRQSCRDFLANYEL